jgi:hypothetical protein
MPVQLYSCHERIRYRCVKTLAYHKTGIVLKLVLRSMVQGHLQRRWYCSEVGQNDLLQDH